MKKMALFTVAVVAGLAASSQAALILQMDSASVPQSASPQQVSVDCKITWSGTATTVAAYSLVVDIPAALTSPTVTVAAGGFNGGNLSQVALGGGSNGVADDTGSPVAMGDGSVLKLFHLTVTVPANTAVGSYPLHLHDYDISDGAANSFVISSAVDGSIGVTTVPEPTTLGILGVAGMMLMRRKPR